MIGSRSMGYLGFSVPPCDQNFLMQGGNYTLTPPDSNGDQMATVGGTTVCNWTEGVLNNPGGSIPVASSGPFGSSTGLIFGLAVGGILLLTAKGF